MIEVQVSVCETLEYTKKISFSSKEEYENFLIAINYKKSNGEFDPTKIKKVSNISINDVVHYDNCGEVCIEAPIGSLELYDFNKLMEEQSVETTKETL